MAPGRLQTALAAPRLGEAMARRLLVLVLAGSLLASGPAAATSPSFTLTPPSPTLAAVPATPADVLSPAGLPVPGPMPAPVIDIPMAALGLVPGDVINSISFGTLPPGPGPGLQIVFSVDGSAVDKVIVGGRLVVEDGRLLTVDLEALREAAQAASDRLLKANAEIKAQADGLADIVGRFCSGLARQHHSFRGSGTDGTSPRMN